jgi:xanthine dehydrogenase accessory factor
VPAELRKLLTLWGSAQEEGEESALATVVHVEGSTYRKPGARMLITRSGRRAGTVSGGCLEAEVSRKIWWLTEGGPAIQDYTTSFDEDARPSYGLGCSGTVTLLLERASRTTDVFDALRASVEQRAHCAIVTVIGTNQQDAPLGSRIIVSEASRSIETSDDLQQLLLPIGFCALDLRQSQRISVTFLGGRLEIFVEYIAPPPALFVFGAGDDAQPVVELAHAMGWETTVAEGRSNLAVPGRFPSADRVVILKVDEPLRDLTITPSDAAVVLTHSYEQDVAILRALLPMKLAYLGVLGPRRRTARIAGQVAASIGMDPERALDSLKSPVGLDLGVGSPHVIALSIVAELQAVLSRRSAMPLHLVTAPLATATHG